MRAFICAMTMAVVAVSRNSADACVYPTLPVHELDPLQMDDKVPPAAPGVTYEVEYIEGDDGTDCDNDFGMIGFSITGADDRTPPSRLGIVTTPVPGGYVPQYFQLFGAPQRDAPYGFEPRNGYVSYWFDYNAKVLDFEMDVRVVDLAGNVSEPTRVHVVHDASGCTACTSSTGWATALCALAFVLRPRRSRARLRQCQKLRSS